VDYNSVAIVISLTVVASKICDIFWKFKQGQKRSSIWVPIESAYATFWDINFRCIFCRLRGIHAFSSKI